MIDGPAARGYDGPGEGSDRHRRGSDGPAYLGQAMRSLGRAVRPGTGCAFGDGLCVRGRAASPGTAICPGAGRASGDRLGRGRPQAAGDGAVRVTPSSSVTYWEPNAVDGVCVPGFTESSLVIARTTESAVRS